MFGDSLKANKIYASLRFHESDLILLDCTSGVYGHFTNSQSLKSGGIEEREILAERDL